MFPKVTKPELDLEGNKNYCFELVGGLSYEGFELPRVKLQQMSENLAEIQQKLIEVST